jgi:hypothetical protein
MLPALRIEIGCEIRLAKHEAQAEGQAGGN